MKTTSYPGNSWSSQIKEANKLAFFTSFVAKFIAHVFRFPGMGYPKRPSYPQDTITIRFFVDQNTGGLSVVESGDVDKVGLYICVSIFSTTARILLGKLKLTPSEVEQLTKIAQDERMA